ncbi:TPA: MbeB family mobilization protein [Salmonella enterica subsp. enterica serovar Poona]|nr:mobilization protein [Salmonella enterica subsp. enterica serovar Chester]HEC9537622.1 MbeB family mobilization protein [Salmonella enterica subsp. enterica serovar Poona]
MSNLLQTGADFEKKLKERAESTEKMLNDEFRRLGKSVSVAVTLSETKIRDAIALYTEMTEKSLSGHQIEVEEAIRRYRLSVSTLTKSLGIRLLATAALLIAASGGTLWYLGGRIQANLEEIRVQEETLLKLNAKTWGVSYLEDNSGRFLVLPEGMRADTNWTMKNGKVNAVKLVRE